MAETRAYYAKEFADYGRKKPTPYMEKLRFSRARIPPDPDQRVLSDEDLEQAAAEDEQNT